MNTAPRQVFMLNMIRRDDDPHKSSKTDAGSQITLSLLTVKNQIKIQHWRTRSYAEHVSLDMLFSDLTKKNDEWVEIFQGKYGRISFGDDGAHIAVFNEMSNDFLKQAAEKLMVHKHTNFNGPEDSDLASIFDDICGLYHKFSYLLTLS
jgi:hypothetical protein